MTIQERLSDAYSDIKCKFEDLKMTCKIQGIKNREMAQKLQSAQNQISELRVGINKLKQEKEEKLSRKEQKIVTVLAEKCGVQDKIIVNLREKIREYERAKSNSMF
jgi:oligoendopeptidase F